METVIQTELHWNSYLFLWILQLIFKEYSHPIIILNINMGHNCKTRGMLLNYYRCMVMYIINN